LWCSGSTCLVRIGQDVFASGLETLADQRPLNNCRWTLFKRTAAGWELQQADQAGRTREPCPLAGFHNGRLFLSANPTLTARDAAAGPARPELLEWKASDVRGAATVRLPGWDGAPPFSEHSYRSFAANGSAGELILFQNIGYTHAEWAFCNAQGEWAAQGRLAWPWGAEYDQPQPIRVCYPNVMLKERSVHFCGVSDIVEPYKRWRDYKKQITGRDWDFDFRRLFYTWSDDITTGRFHEWVELASRDATCGWISPCDLWVAPDGRAHVLWNERAIDERLRAEFFPEAKQSHALNYAIVEKGQVILRRPLMRAEEGGAHEVAGAARFHVTPDHRLLVFYYVSGTDAQGSPVSENRLAELTDDGRLARVVPVPLAKPFTACFTTTVRGGSPPSNLLELLGTRAGQHATISYARINLGGL
jgi:hypothetical protein